MGNSSPPAGSPPPARRGRQGPVRARCPRRFTSACAERTAHRGAGCPERSVHLRLRGEDGHFGSFRAPTAGSPPPARRGQPPLHRRGSGLRFTSACAERTGPRSACTRPAPVHLRLRGEDSVPLSSHSVRAGSPPPARRGRQSHMNRTRNTRFTSACAERTGHRRRRRGSRSVHLRLRGEDPSRPAVLGALCRFVIQGTPVMHPPESTGAAQPLAGTDRRTAAHLCRRGGQARTMPLRTVAAHLRSHGERESCSNPALTWGGLPPLARRARHLRRPGRHARRPTSACAESASRRSRACWLISAHLCLRGERASYVNTSA